MRAPYLENSVIFLFIRARLGSLKRILSAQWSMSLTARLINGWVSRIKQAPVRALGVFVVAASISNLFFSVYLNGKVSVLTTVYCVFFLIAGIFALFSRTSWQREE